MEIFKLQDPIIVQSPIYSTARNHSVERLTESCTIAIWTSPRECINARKAELFSGNTASAKQ
ncbi:MAG: hypothetical protein WBE48_24725 [Xanthobacteraceae bacterium]|jgi:hypothetical protein